MDDESLWNAFHDQTLPEADWHHHAHLRVAWMHLARWQLDEAHVLMRVGIIRLNAAHGLQETPTRGYHETITRGWLLLVQAARTGEGRTSSSAFIERHAEALGKDALLRHYTRERLTSVAARAAFHPPDRAAF